MAFVMREAKTTERLGDATSAAALAAMDCCAEACGYADAQQHP